MLMEYKLIGECKLKYYFCPKLYKHEKVSGLVGYYCNAKWL